LKQIQLNPQQLEAISHRDGPMVVLSVVGSGKTMVLTERIIHLIEEYKRQIRLNTWQKCMGIEPIINVIKSTSYTIRRTRVL